MRKFSTIPYGIIGLESTIPSLHTSMTDGIILSKLRKLLHWSNFLKFTLFERSRIDSKMAMLDSSKSQIFEMSRKSLCVVLLYKTTRFARNCV